MSSLLNREDVIHFSVRQYLNRTDWLLIAGEYPNGSDDELHSLRIMDPFFSRDQSPDHRRHSLNKLVPDLIAYKGNEFLIIEMKPRYSKLDEEKLIELLDNRRDDLLIYLEEFIKRYMPNIKIDARNCKLSPALGFSHEYSYRPYPGFVYLLVMSLNSVKLVRS